VWLLGVRKCYLRDDSTAFLSSSSFTEKAIQDQKDYGSECCDDDAAEIERLDLSETHEAAKEAAEKTTHDSNENRHEETAGVIAGNYKLGERAGY